MDTITRVKSLLKNNFSGSHDKNGYTQMPQDNLLPGISLSDVEDELRHGDGNELKMKFCALHSSAALAVNCFGFFKVCSENLLILNETGAENVVFEKKMKIFPRGAAPNLDVWIERVNDDVAVESKFLEYFTPKEPKFSVNYEKLAPPFSEQCWWDLYQNAKNGKRQNLDCAQLIKHYFGLKKFLAFNPEKQKINLLYIFWEPLNWQDVDVCMQHREELNYFTEAVSSSRIKFCWMSYNDLWEKWSAIPSLKIHANNLKTRYQFFL